MKGFVHGKQGCHFFLISGFSSLRHNMKTWISTSNPMKLSIRFQLLTFNLGESLEVEECKRKNLLIYALSWLQSQMILESYHNALNEFVCCKVTRLLTAINQWNQQVLLKVSPLQVTIIVSSSYPSPCFSLY